MAASCQLALLLTGTLTVWFFEPHNLMGQETRIACHEESFCIHYLSLLIWSYLILAKDFSFRRRKVFPSVQNVYGV